MSTERLLSGLSGARVIEHDGIVEKTGPSVRAELDWYAKVRRFGFNGIPKVLGIVHDKEDGTDTLGMKFVESLPLTEVNANELVDEIDRVINVLKKMPLGIPPRDVETMCDRIERHFFAHPELYDHASVVRLQKALAFEPARSILDANHSFCHGDLAIDNILWTYEQGAVLIDPIYLIDMYSSWLTDIAKLIASIQINIAIKKWSIPETVYFGDLESRIYMRYKDYESALKPLIVYQIMRTVKYRMKNDAERVAILMKDKMGEYGI